MNVDWTPPPQEMTWFYSYSFWVNQVAKVHKLSETDPEARLIPAQLISSPRKFERIKSPEGKHYVIYTGSVPKQPEHSIMQTATPAQFRYEIAPDTEKGTAFATAEFQRIKKDFAKTFGATPSTIPTTLSHPIPYVVSESAVNLVDANDPDSFNAISPEMEKAFREAISRDYFRGWSPWLTTKEWYNGRIKELEAGNHPARYVRIGNPGRIYSVETLNAITSSGLIVFYTFTKFLKSSPTILIGSSTFLAVSDGKGHFVFLTPSSGDLPAAELFVRTTTLQ